MAAPVTDATHTKMQVTRQLGISFLTRETRDRDNAGRDLEELEYRRGAGTCCATGDRPCKDWDVLGHKSTRRTVRP